MSGYGAFARYYDLLTRNVDYPARAAQYSRLLELYSRCRPLSTVLDLACGTGSLTVELAALGYDMIGVDASLDMLSVASGKAADTRCAPPLFLCQEMTQIDLYGTVDACVCALDSVNHLPDRHALRRAFARVALFLNPGAVFAFDANTAYKHREVLGGNCFVYDLDELCCVWQNEYSPGDGSVRMTLDFFVPDKRSGLYARSTERIREQVFSPEEIARALDSAGLELLEQLDEGGGKPHERSERVIYVARKAGRVE